MFSTDYSFGHPERRAPHLLSVSVCAPKHTQRAAGWNISAGDGERQRRGLRKKIRNLNEAWGRLTGSPPKCDTPQITQQKKMRLLLDLPQLRERRTRLCTTRPSLGDTVGSSSFRADWKKAPPHLESGVQGWVYGHFGL